MTDRIAPRQITYICDLALMDDEDRPVCEYPGCKLRVSGLAVVVVDGEATYYEMCTQHVYSESKE